MSTVEEVREAEKKARELLEKLRNARAFDPENLCEQVEHAVRVYKKAVRELRAA